MPQAQVTMSGWVLLESQNEIHICVVIFPFDTLFYI